MSSIICDRCGEFEEVTAAKERKQITSTTALPVGGLAIDQHRECTTDVTLGCCCLC